MAILGKRKGGDWSKADFLQGQIFEIEECEMMSLAFTN